ncbi:hypothetical protein C8F01DRAFT_1126188 [Mycena amicta]|nr:hypothetical protein C8F01DRAFT_1126188 [Mycena amicta]
MQPRRPSGPPLPSIQTLHPYLPPPSTSTFAGEQAQSTSTSVPTVDASPPVILRHRGPPSDAVSEDDQLQGASGHGKRVKEEEEEESERPAKKRKRQALSCTGVAQPCGPCARRGDEAKCQWHVVEPASEKYVPRAEHEALRRRVETLENYLRHIPPAVLSTLPPLPGLSAPGPYQPLPSGLPGFAPLSFPPPPMPGPLYETQYSFSPPGHFDPIVTHLERNPNLRARTSSPTYTRRHTNDSDLRLPPPETQSQTQTQTPTLDRDSESESGQRLRDHRRRASGYGHTYSAYPPPPPLRPLLPRAVSSDLLQRVSQREPEIRNISVTEARPSRSTATRRAAGRAGSPSTSSAGDGRAGDGSPSGSGRAGGGEMGSSGIARGGAAAGGGHGQPADAVTQSGHGGGGGDEHENTRSERSGSLSRLLASFPISPAEMPFHTGFPPVRVLSVFAVTQEHVVDVQSFSTVEDGGLMQMVCATVHVPHLQRVFAAKRAFASAPGCFASSALLPTRSSSAVQVLATHHGHPPSSRGCRQVGISKKKPILRRRPVPILRSRAVVSRCRGHPVYSFAGVGARGARQRRCLCCALSHPRKFMRPAGRRP